MSADYVPLAWEEQKSFGNLQVRWTWTRFSSSCGLDATKETSLVNLRVRYVLPIQLCLGARAPETTPQTRHQASRDPAWFYLQITAGLSHQIEKATRHQLKGHEFGIWSGLAKEFKRYARRKGKKSLTAQTQEGFFQRAGELSGVTCWGQAGGGGP